MPSFTFELPWSEYLLWNAVSLGVALFLNSFIEWAAHRFILHSKKIVRFAYEKHHLGHHGMFGHDETYHVQNDYMRDHIVFVWQDYAFFLMFTTPLWIGAELIAGKPFVLGGVLATLAGLQAFNSLHWRFHSPSDTWFQRTRFFQYLKNHHRAHHADTRKNFNVHFFPIADWILGTFKRPAPMNPAGQKARDISRVS